MIIKDSMVVIHLAKITLLEKSCNYFEKVIIPMGVYNEIMAGKKNEYSEINIIEELIQKNKISIKKIKNKKYSKKVKEFRISGGEAEAVVLYWQEKANYLATDDDNVRKKSILLSLNVIGTPVIILKLYKDKKIDKGKFLSSVIELKKIGWFSNSIIDKLLMEAK